MEAELPPPSGAPIAIESSPGALRRNPVPLFVGAVAAALCVGIGVGLALGLAMMSSSASSCTPSDGWCELGAAVLGLLAGVVTGVIGYVVAGVMIIRRPRPHGARAGHEAALVLLPPSALLALSGLAELVTTVR